MTEAFGNGVKPSSAPATRVEGAARVVILAGVGLMAGAASFTHMHDWTMANAPAGTGDWFGWANAVASELTPTVAVLDIRKRRRAGKTGRALAFPALVLVGAAGLSLAAQFARAKPSFSGWLLAAVPAVAFLVLTKLVLSGSGPAASSAPASGGMASVEPPKPAGVADIPPVKVPASGASAAVTVPAPSRTFSSVTGSVVVPHKTNGAVVTPR